MRLSHDHLASTGTDHFWPSATDGWVDGAHWWVQTEMCEAVNLCIADFISGINNICTFSTFCCSADEGFSPRASWQRPYPRGFWKQSALVWPQGTQREIQKCTSVFIFQQLHNRFSWNVSDAAFLEKTASTGHWCKLLKQPMVACHVQINKHDYLIIIEILSNFGNNVFFFFCIRCPSFLLGSNQGFFVRSCKHYTFLNIMKLIIHDWTDIKKMPTYLDMPQPDCSEWVCRISSITQYNSCYSW